MRQVINKLFEEKFKKAKFKIFVLFIFSLFISACSTQDGEAPVTDPAVIESGVKIFDVTSTVSTTTAGVVQNFEITARDDQNNIFTDYTGSISVATSDPNAELSWSTISYTSGMAGVANISIKFKTAGTHDIQITEQNMTNAANGLLSSFIVTHGPIKNFSLASLATTIAGQSQTMTVSAVDEFSNVVKNYSGTAQITSSDVAGVFPNSVNFIPADLGIKTISYTLKTAGSRKLVAQDLAVAGSMSDSNSILVVPSTPTQLIFANIPTSAGAGVSQSSQATIQDAFNNIATNYIGNFSITSSDAIAVLPATISYTVMNAGVVSFSYELRTSGNQTINLSNVGLGINRSSSTISVTVGTPSSTFSTLVITPNTAPANNITTSTVTITVKDAYSNNVSGASITLSSVSSGVTLTQPMTNTNASGVATGAVKSIQTGVKIISVSSPVSLISLSNTITYTAPSLTAPQNLTLTGRGAENISPVVSWSAPADVGLGISYYEIAVGTTAGASNISAWRTIPGGGSISTYTIQNAIDGFSLSLSYDTTYYISLRAVDTASTVSSAVSSSWQIAWTPRAFGVNLKFWFDGSDASTVTLDGSTRVSQWNDKSVNNYIVSQATAANRPTSVDFLNSKGFVFDTTTKRLGSTTGATFLDSDGFSAFFVQQTPAGGTWRALISTLSNKNFALFSTSSGTAYRFFNGAHTTAPIQSANAQITGYIAVPAGNFVDRRDGTQIQTSSISATTHAINNFAIGNYVFTNQAGTAVSTIGEVVVLETGSSQANWEKIEGYLAHKWNLQANLPAGHPYKLSGP